MQGSQPDEVLLKQFWPLSDFLVTLILSSVSPSFLCSVGPDM